MKALDKTDVPGIDAFLAHLVYHGNRGVALGAMEALWNRTPTKPVIDALWHRAVPASLAAENWHEIYREDAYRFHGTPIACTVAGESREPVDGDVAADVLIHLHEAHPEQTHEVSERLTAILKDAAKAASTYPVSHAIDDHWYTDDAMINIYHLAVAYRPDGVTDSLYAIATSPISASHCRIVGEGNDQSTWAKVSTRLSAKAALLLLNHEDPQHFGLRFVPGWKLWGVPASTNEATAIDTLTKRGLAGTLK